MARGPRKTVEEKIAEKEEVIFGLQRRIKSEQKELDALYSEKKIKDLEALNELIQSSGLNEDEVSQALDSYIRAREQNIS